MKELATDVFPVAVTCRVLRLSRPPYYRWLANPVTPSEVVEAYRSNAFVQAHKDDPEFGHRLLADDACDVGEPMADRTAWRIAPAHRWWSVSGKKRGKNEKRPGPAVHDDLCTFTDENGRVRHVFTASGPNQLWLTDITEHSTAWIPVIVATLTAIAGIQAGEGKLRLCAIKDVFGNKLVGYSIDSRMKSSLAANGLNNAVAMRGDVAGRVVPSHRGSRFRSRKFLRALAAHRMVVPLGRVA